MKKPPNSFNASDKLRAQMQRTLARHFREHPGGHFGWDWPTLALVFPEVASELRALSRELREMKSAGL